MRSFVPRREPGRYLDTSAGPVFVARRRAPGSARPPLVLVHGWLMAHGYFAALVDALRDRELVLVDLPGHGESACPSPERFAYDLPSYASVLGEVLDALQLGPIDLLGHSLGGGVALRTAIARPEVRRLALVAPLVYGIPVPLEAQLLMLRGLGPLLWRYGVRRADFVRTMRRDYEDQRVVGDELVDWSYTRFCRPGARAATLATFLACVGLPDASDLPARVRQPTLVLWGDADRLVPLGLGRRLMVGLADARLAVIPATGHTPFVERPGLVVDELRGFLDGTAT